METSAARRAWSALDTAWQHAIATAWEYYRGGAVAVGAVVTDETGAVLGQGRNQRFDAQAPRGLLANPGDFCSVADAWRSHRSES